MISGQRWPELDDVSGWADALNAPASLLIMAWLQDKAPTAELALLGMPLAEAFELSGIQIAPEFVHRVEQLASLPNDARRHVMC